MPFIVPTGILMYKMKKLHTTPPHLRVNFLKNIFLCRAFSYPTIFLISNIVNLF
tara:strand:+ start:175 stop:336 length:162 start_codon:yes stop_codon:yes gene_type:complete